jgi:osmotically inducible lipoprotein OsmB
MFLKTTVDGERAMTINKAVVMTVGLLALSLAACTTTQERVGGAGAGALAGAAVAGPVGAAVGGVGGALAGPTVSNEVGVKKKRTHRRHRTTTTPAAETAPAQSH